MNMPGQWEEPLIPNSNLVLFLALDTLRYLYPGISYSVYRELCLYDSNRLVTEAKIQQVEEDLRNGTLLGLGKD
ncbi:hypothetical protein OCU04_008582 [Sclerotinia nivalis]|uniref:Uncharacterized protein n=1 Tax=Sclerotinia nivalis TaxID=352851 RepID=A0A9X0AJ87_9HELO|nr:hypothetical protein OCU04_008582 [Sclerotinia nivalis]